MKFRNVAFASTAAVIAAVAIGTGAAQASDLIGSHDIKDDSVRSIDIRDGGVHQRDLGVHLQGKIAKHAVDDANGQDAQVSTYLRKTQIQIPAGSNVEGDAVCDAGDRVTGGGYSSSDQTDHWSKIVQNRMTWIHTGDENTPDAWHVQALGGDSDGDVYVWAICLAS
jgi:hypothetical protein